jgi:hypothetical protein
VKAGDFALVSIQQSIFLKAIIRNSNCVFAEGITLMLIPPNHFLNDFLDWVVPFMVGEPVNC